jgi:transposase
MDTSAVVRNTDALGRPGGPRRKYTIAEKRKIAEETLQPGASVAVVARRHEINANLVFGWRRLHQQGLLAETAPVKTPPLLPVKVSTPTLLPSKRMKAPAAPVREATASGSIEIEFAGGQRLWIRGRVDRATLGRVIDLLSRR